MAKTYDLDARLALLFDIVAEFPDTDAGTDAANAYCATHDVGVIAVQHGKILLAPMPR